MRRVIGAAALIVAGTTAAGGQQSAQSSVPADVSLKTAINRELADGDLKAAIARYQGIVDQYGKTDRPIAAQALLRIGEAYEKLGAADASKVYDTLIRQYPDQPDIAAAARARLAARQTAMPRGGTITLTKIFDGPDAGRYGAISRDGRYLTFMDSKTQDLGILDLVGGQQRRITTHPEHSGEFAEYSRFSRDGQRLAYGWSNIEGKYELRTINREGGAARTLFSSASWLQPYDWSPDGRTVLAIIADNHTRQLVFISAADGSRRVLKTLDWNMGVPDHAEYSPDGRFIAYDRVVTEETGRGRDVFVIAVDGTTETPVASGPSNENLLGWFPDGVSLLVSSDRTGSVGAYSIPIRNGRAEAEPRLVKPDLGRIDPYGFTAAGDFVYDLRVGTGAVWTVPIDPQTGMAVDKPAPIPNDRSPRSAPSWSPDNEHISFRMGAIGGAIGIGIQSVKTSALRTLPVKLSYAEAPVWTPDGHALVLFGADLDAREGIFEIDAATGAAKMIADTGGFGGPVAITPDGQSLVYRTYENQPQSPPGTVIICRNLKTREQRDVIRRRDPNISAFQLSPDGASLALRVGSDDAKSASLEIVPLAGGTPRAVLTFDDPGALPRGFAWTTDGKSLLYVQANALWRVSVTGGAAEKLNISMRGMNAISVSPDGRHLAFGVQDIKEEIWSMQHVAPASGSR
jgi:Tol biopolymer transport system component